MFLRHDTKQLDRRKRPRLQGESLEARLSLDGSHVLQPSNSAHLTLSFVPDGTSVAGYESGLFAKLDQLAEPASWQDKILSAFQVWSAETNADIGRVTDDGEPLGGFGPRRQSLQHGDVRIAAAPLREDIFAISLPADGIISGTWAGDVIINSNAAFASLDDLYAVMVHEAGHVFGLDHSDDPQSPMHVHGITPAVSPTPTDLELLQTHYGVRAVDVNEVSERNDTPGRATILKEASFQQGEPGSAPGLAFGDLGRGDVDYFLLETPSSYEGPLTVRVRTRGLSQLHARVSLYNEDEQLLATQLLLQGDVEDAILTIATAKGDDAHYLRIEGADESPASIGGYAVIVTIDGRLQVPWEQTAAIISNEYRHVEPSRFRDFWEHGKDPLQRDDLHADDQFALAVEAKTAAGFARGGRYDIAGSISTSTDVDYYAFRTHADSDALLISYRAAAESGGLVPEMQLLDGAQQPVPGSLLVNGAGEQVWQFEQVAPDTNYVLRVAPKAPGVQYDTGNYQIAIQSSQSTVALPPVASGVLTPDDTLQEHVLYVAQPQLLHLLLDVSGTDVDGTDAVYFSIVDTTTQMTVGAGDRRSAGGILLQPGEYALRLRWASADGALPSTGSLQYTLFADTVSSPFGVIPIDPLTEPQYTCGSVSPQFCFPDGTSGDKPIQFIETGTGSGEQIVLIDPGSILDDWWLLQQQSPPTGNRAPSAQADSYTTSFETPLEVSAGAGVLSNDVDPDGDPLTAILIAQAQHGLLTFADDGSFRYVPFAGFSGTDRFEYVAIDEQDESQVVQVTILVMAVVPIAGDANRDGRFDSADLIQVFAAGQFEDAVPGNSVWETGDWDGDGDFTTSDLVLAFQQGSYQAD